MACFNLKSTRNRVIASQAAIVIGLLVFYKLALPRIQQAREASETAAREQRMMAFVHSVAAEVGRAQGEAGDETSESGGRPQYLRGTPQVGDVEQELGLPQQSMNDFMGGQHLTWIGTRHKLVASFNKGKLYALTLTDLKTGHGTQIFESSAQWRVF
jgi:hypothetical protein